MSDLAVVHESAVLSVQRYTALDKMIKEMKAEQDAIKQRLLESMTANGVKKITCDAGSVTLIEATDRETFDTKGFRAVYPKLYDDFAKITPVKASVRVTVNHGQ